MAVNLVSPGVNIREVDLTRGNIVPGLQNIGAIAGPFEKGPVNTPTLIENEQQLLQVFGKPQEADDQYEYWLSASNYLSYGGTLQVVRSDKTEDSNALTNANASLITTNLKIYSNDDYNNDHSGDTSWIFSAKTPGSWANGLKVCIIDSAADQIISGISTQSFPTIQFVPTITNRTGTLVGGASTIGISTTLLQLGQVVRCDLSGVVSSGTTITGISAGVIAISNPSLSQATVTTTFDIGVENVVLSSSPIEVGMAVAQEKLDVQYISAAGVVTAFNGRIRGIVTKVGNNSIDVKITDRIPYINSQNTVSGVGTFIDYNRGSEVSSFTSLSTNPINIVNNSGNVVAILTEGTTIDWYDNQSLDLKNSNLLWKSIAPKPGTSQYALERNAKNDEVHIVVIDDNGLLTGIPGNIVEKYLNLSKASDSRVSPSQSIYYKNTINQRSSYIYAGQQENGVASGLVPTGIGVTTYILTSDGWDKTTQDSIFDVVGKRTYSLSNGKDYSGTNYVGGYNLSSSNIIKSYKIFENSEDFNINYLIYGPSSENEQASQYKANELITIAESRKDCVVVISPHKSAIINVADPTTQTENILSFFAPITSSSYAVFDSGYKYTLDRFNNKFVYIPCNSDIAGLMAKTSINNYPWFSPAGSSRGSLNNVVKLAYNPTLSQRDQLYSNRINPIISSPGAGFILFGDKTALSYTSAFDRINVRMLFLTIEKAIEQAARAQLFEFNDAITRSNFINIVEPYLRDVRAKRGITEFLIVCDESNNTPDVIDANQFKADIFVKPARSINFIGLTFVATRTGVSFSEVVGTV